MNYLQRLLDLSCHVRRRSKLENIEKLSAVLLRPELSYPTIHIAGSNGKGSVSLKIASVLQLAGYRVGLYTSPHLYHFSERIQINGQCIQDASIENGLELLFKTCKEHGIEPNYFELATMLAFDFFRKNSVDIAVIEAGIGGRLDATNVVKPMLSVITSLSKEHTHILGSTLEEIAFEKAGIIKENTPVVLGPRVPAALMAQIAIKRSAPIYQANEISSFYDLENQATARCALQILLHEFPKASGYIEEGVSVRPGCRFEKIGNFLFDVAHNPEAFDGLFKAVNIFYPDRIIRAVIGMCEDKDVRSCLVKAVSADHIYLVEANTKRAAPKAKMAEILQSLPYSKYSLEENVTSALRKASQEKNTITIVCGSFYLMDEAKKALRQLTDLSLSPSGLS